MLPDTPGLSFMRPWALLLLPLAAALCWLLYHQVNRYSAWDKLLPLPVRRALLQRQAGGRHAGRFLFLGSAWLVAILALGGPVWQSPAPPNQLNQSALVVVWDVSRNMLATDLQPNRLERARLKIRDIMQMHSDSQLALIAFAGTAHPVTPLSSDMDTLGNLLSALEPDIMPQDGQNLDAALTLARQMLADQPPENSRVLLITSGVEQDQMDPLRRHASVLGARLSILGVGTPEGSPVPLTEGGLMRDARGRILLPRLDSASLANLARSAGSRYQQIRLDDRDLEILAPVAQHLTDEAAGRQFSLNDQGHWLLLLLLPLAAMGARRGWLGLLLCAALLPTPGEASTWDDLWQRPDQQALRLLDKQQPLAAAERFEDPQWRAWALYQAGDYQAASKAYERLLSAHPDDPEYHFNHGTALAMAGQYQEALEAYEQTLTRAPEHQAARQNRSRVEALLERLAKEEQEKQALEENADQSTAENGNDPSPTETTTEQDAGANNAQADPSAPADSMPAPDSGTAAASPGTQPGADTGGQTSGAAGQADGDQTKGGDRRDPSGNNEQQAALHQWLQDIPDDPSKLLKRKFMYQRLRQLEDLSR